MIRYTRATPAQVVLLSTVGLLMAACSGGVDLAEAPASSVQNDAGSGFSSAITVNSAENTADEPLARAYAGTTRSVQAECGGLAQTIDEAFSTDAFDRVLDENGEPYLLASRPDSRDTPEYIEFCVSVEQLATYQFFTQIRAPSVLEDSYFITVDEDAVGADDGPGIYDVSFSAGFQQHRVRTRTQNPFEVSLGVGEHVIRLYYREPNIALKSLRLEAQAGTDPVDPPVSDAAAIAQCATNTGLSVSAVEQLLETYMGSTTLKFIFEPAKKNTGYTVRDDWGWETADGRGNVICLSSPPADGFNLVVNSITANRLVIGSQGPDEHYFRSTLTGTFIGNGGDDEVGIIRGGLFIGGEGDDKVSLMYDGVVEGGNGDDEVRTMEGGEFNAGNGNDLVGVQSGGFYDGGAGTDTLTRQGLNGTSVNVEITDESVTDLLPPANLVIVDPTPDSVLLSWDASPDQRTQGYVINVEDDRSPNTSADFGAAPSSVSLKQTSQTTYPMGRFYEESYVFLVRAYTELENGKFLYSDPIDIDYQVPSDESYLAGLPVLGTTVVNDAIQTASLLADGDALLGVDGFVNSTDVPLYIELSNGLSNEVPVFNETVASRDYRHHLAGAVQYVISFPFDSMPTLRAFSSNGQTTSWESQLSLPPFLPAGATSPGRSQCTRAIVTQDDDLACVPLRGGLELFDPTGGSAVFTGASLDYYGALLDGENGVLVQVNDSRRTPLTSMVVVTPSAQLQQTLPLAMSTVLNAGERAEPAGIVVHNGNAIITGVVRDDTCRQANNCQLYEDDTLAYFIVRASIATGELSNFQRFALSDRAGAGIGKVIDGEVIFGGRNVVTRYRLDTLDIIERLGVPGTVLDISSDAYLSRTYNGPGFARVSDLFLIGR